MAVIFSEYKVTHLFTFHEDLISLCIQCPDGVFRVAAIFFGKATVIVQV